MAKVILKLTDDDGKVTEFTKTRIKARAIRKALEAQVKIDQKDKDEDYIGQIETMIDYVVDLFHDQRLTADAIWDGLECDELVPVLQGVFNAVLGQGEAEGVEPKKS